MFLFINVVRFGGLGLLRRPWELLSCRSWGCKRESYRRFGSRTEFNVGQIESMQEQLGQNAHFLHLSFHQKSEVKGCFIMNSFFWSLEQKARIHIS